jgi:DNA-binding transcriptional ArsR family regulator
MLNQSRLAEIGALIGDPGRANMLDALMDGRALTARELAGAAGVAPQTASGHSSKLIEAGLIAMEQHGRHRYHRLASAEVAHLLKSIAHFAVRPKDEGNRTVRTGPRDAVDVTAEDLPAIDTFGIAAAGQENRGHPRCCHHPERAAWISAGIRVSSGTAIAFHAALWASAFVTMVGS